MGLPRVGYRPRIPGRGETRQDCRWRGGRRPAGLRVRARGETRPCGPRWTSWSCRGAAAPRWMTDGARPRDGGRATPPTPETQMSGGGP
ncbi:hypothetical protein NDU88_003526 [Pleurodeles waltl]|uniref:Uncharacterized protein n=1 Tax=Pleurodeles waltl TaxID=8319 RepID=A0AAV7PEW9_PLEWA|nr:hypothetical protein NDU88_003526 [Pleurodeles waltl]